MRQMQRCLRIADHKERLTLVVGCGASSISRSGAGTLGVRNTSWADRDYEHGYGVSLWSRLWVER